MENTSGGTDEMPGDHRKERQAMKQAGRRPEEDSPRDLHGANRDRSTNEDEPTREGAPPAKD